MASQRNTAAIAAGLLAAAATWFAGAAQRRRLEQQLAARVHEATHDQLTGMLNRRGMESLLTGVRLPCSVALLDLVRFKAINDVHGYEAGDLVLQTVAARLAAALGHHRVARLGGDEFVAVLEHREASDPVEDAARLRAHLGQPIRLVTDASGSPRPHTSAATVSVPPRIGLVVLEDPATVREALRAAAVAVFRAKEAGAAVQRFSHGADARLAATTHSRPIHRFRDQRTASPHLRALPTSA